jgi:acetyltransferase-like isoleucine patch superfamily enzyme
MKKFIKKIILRYIHSNNQVKDFNLLSMKAQINRSILDDEVRISEYAIISDSKIGYLSSVGKYTKIIHCEIGKFCSVSWDATINAVSHPVDHLTINAFPYVPYVGNFVKDRSQSYKKVVIRNDVWIGANSVIMPGITIGNGAIIGAGAVVTKDVPDYAIVAGVPAKIIKYRFDQETINKLLELKWWNLKPEVIKKNIHLWQNKLDKNSLEILEKLCN